MSGDWLHAWNEGAALWSAGMGRACWQGVLFILLVWAVCRFVPRLPAGARCWLWWLACLKLLLGLAWTTPPALPLLPSAPRAAEPPAAPLVLELPVPSESVAVVDRRSALLPDPQISFRTNRGRLAMPSAHTGREAGGAVTSLQDLRVLLFLMVVWLACI